MILEVDNVELYFSEKRILNGIYLKAETGKVTGILGRNGSGKSCLMSIVFGSLQPKYKSIRLDGKPITKPLFSTNTISYLSQHQLSPNNLKIKNVFKLLKLDWAEFITVFQSFSPYFDKKAKSLSGGELRVLEAYLMLKSKKNIILLDEPFSHIAPLYIEKFKELIQIEKANKIILLTDHYYKDVIDVLDNLYLLKNGCTKAVNDMKELEDYNYLNANSVV